MSRRAESNAAGSERAEGLGLRIHEFGAPRRGTLFPNSATALAARAAWARAPGAARRAARADAEVSAAMEPGGPGESAHLGLVALGADPDAKSSAGQSWVDWSIATLSAALTRALMGAGADLRVGHPAALAMEAGYPGLAKALVEAGASASERPERLPPMLCMVVDSRSAGMEMLGFLIDRGAPVDERDDMGRTALVRACSMSPPRAAAAYRLLGLGADPEAVDNAGLGAADYAAMNGDPELGSELRGAAERAREAREIAGAAAEPRGATPRQRL